MTPSARGDPRVKRIWRRERRSQKQSVHRGGGEHLFYSESIRESSEKKFVKPNEENSSFVVDLSNSYELLWFFITRVVKTL